MNRNNWLLTIGLVVGGLCLFGVGFFVGTKIQQSPEQAVLGAQTVVEKKIEVLSVPGVYWIKAGEAPVCPESHPIKGKFDSYTGYFYARDHKGYDKIKPLLCFVSEEYATKEAGFLKKY